MPENPTRVCAPVFLNRTYEPGVETLFTQAFREQLALAGRLASKNCEAVVKGQVESLTGAQTMTELAGYRVTASVRLQLVKNDRVLSEAVVTLGEEYLPGADVLLTESQRQAALQRLAQNLMRHGYQQLAGVW